MGTGRYSPMFRSFAPACRLLIGHQFPPTACTIPAYAAPCQISRAFGVIAPADDAAALKELLNDAESRFKTYSAAALDMEMQKCATHSERVSLEVPAVLSQPAHSAGHHSPQGPLACYSATHSGATVRGELGVVPTARIPSTHVPGPLCIPFS